MSKNLLSDFSGDASIFVRMSQTRAQLLNARRVRELTEYLSKDVCSETSSHTMFHIQRPRSTSQLPEDVSSERMFFDVITQILKHPHYATTSQAKRSFTPCWIS